MSKSVPLGCELTMCSYHHVVYIGPKVVYLLSEGQGGLVSWSCPHCRHNNVVQLGHQELEFVRTFVRNLVIVEHNDPDFEAGYRHPLSNVLMREDEVETFLFVLYAGALDPLAYELWRELIALDPNLRLTRP